MSCCLSFRFPFRFPFHFQFRFSFTFVKQVPPILSLYAGYLRGYERIPPLAMSTMSAGHIHAVIHVVPLRILLERDYGCFSPAGSLQVAPCLLWSSRFMVRVWGLMVRCETEKLESIRNLLNPAE